MVSTTVVRGVNGLRVSFPVNSATPMPTAVIVSVDFIKPDNSVTMSLTDYPATIPANAYIVYLADILKADVTYLPLGTVRVKVNVWNSLKTVKYVTDFIIPDPTVNVNDPAVSISIGALTLTAI